MEYLKDPSLLPSKVGLGGCEHADVQSFVLTAALISLTGNRMPCLLNDWSHLHKYLRCSSDVSKQEQYAPVVAALNMFQDDLKHLESVVDQRNVTRLKLCAGNKFNSFNPRVMECSVSV